MRARSAWLSHPRFKATWVAIAAGSLAGLAVLGACSQDSAKVVGTRPVPDSPRLGTVVGGNAHVVKVCSDLTSTGGPVTVNVSFQGGMLELNAVDPDRINTYQYNFGPYTTPDVITSSVTISPNECKTVFERNNTCPALADCSDPLQHLGNRLWTNESNTTSPPPGGSGTPPQGAVSVPWPNIPQIYSGIVNPRAGVYITAVIPNGYTMDNLVCTNDDPSLPQSCVNGGYSSANVFHGSTFTYTFTAPATVNGRMTGGGNQIVLPGEVKITRGFTLHCDIVLSNNLEINWGKNKWHLDKPISTAECLDDPNTVPFPPDAPFDTFIGTAVGTLNGVDGSRIEFTFVDNGEPGTTDKAAIKIYGTGANSNSAVLNLPLALLTRGNVQAHYDQPHK